MPRKLLKYGPPVNRITWFTRFNYALRNGYSADVENWTPPDKSSSENTRIHFRASNYFVANVDWGDGIVEQYQSQKSGSYYYVTFRSMRTTLADYGAYFSYETVPPHHYEDDDTNALRTVTVTFSTNIDYISSYVNRFEKFPILEFPELAILSLKNAGIPEEIPFDFFKNIPNLTSLSLGSSSTIKGSVMPESLFTMTKMKTLNIVQCFKIEDVDKSGVRNISKLKELQALYISGNSIGKYLKEYNELPKLWRLEMWESASFPIHGIESSQFPDMEADFSPLVTDLYLLYGSTNTKWGEHLTDYDLTHIKSFGVNYCRNLPWDDMPDWFRNMRAMTAFDVNESLYIQSDADGFWNSMYRLVTEWEYSSMSSNASDGNRNQFYGLNIRYRNSSNNHYNLLPTGSYQAPEGFIKGSSNGSPANPMEKLYVLKNNYNMIFTGISDADLQATVSTANVVNRGGVIVDYQIFNIGEEVRHAA